LLVLCVSVLRSLSLSYCAAQVQTLVDLCVFELSGALITGNVCERLLLAERYGLKDLKVGWQ
jgi:hypothetical protein